MSLSRLLRDYREPVRPVPRLVIVARAIGLLWAVFVVWHTVQTDSDSAINPKTRNTRTQK